MPSEPDFSPWLSTLKVFFDELGLERIVDHSSVRRPFDLKSLELMRELRPEFISFHFGLPLPRWVLEWKGIGVQILSTATSLREARDLEERGGADFIILQGLEAGGHRGMYLEEEISSQSGSFALLGECRDKVRTPLILAGGIGSSRDVARALQEGASAVQVGTAFLLSDEVILPSAHRAALRLGGETVITNVMTGRFARGIANGLMKEVGGSPIRCSSFSIRCQRFGLVEKNRRSQRLSSFFPTLVRGGSQ